MSVAIGIASSPVFLNTGVGSGGVTPPAAPTNLVAVQNGSDVDLTWTDNSTDEDGFKIYRSSDNVIFAEIDDIAAGSTAYTDLNPGNGQWWYYVAAYNVGGESDSNVATVIVFVGALDGVSNLVHIYDIARRWVSSYEGNLVRLRRNSDNAELDFTYVANGDLDVAAINTWLGGASGFIVTVYDQISGDDVIQATAGNQPAFVASGQNGHSVGRYATDDFLDAAQKLLSSATPRFSVYQVTKTSAAATMSPWGQQQPSSQVFSSGGNLRLELVYKSATTNVARGGTNIAQQWYVQSLIHGALADSIHLNGVAETIAYRAGSFVAGNDDSVADYSIGRVDPVTGRYWNGDIATKVIANEEHDTTNRQAAEAALEDYWNIIP